MSIFFDIVLKMSNYWSRYENTFFNSITDKFCWRNMRLGLNENRLHLNKINKYVSESLTSNIWENINVLILCL